MNPQIQPKQLITLGLSIALAVGSYWIPLPPRVSMPNSLERLTYSSPIELGIFTPEPVKVWPSQ